MIVHETEEVFFFLGENRADICGHFLPVAAGFKRHISPGEPGHGIELHEVEVILALAPDLSEDFVEGELLVKKSGACIKRVGAKVDPCTSATHSVLFF